MSDDRAGQTAVSIAALARDKRFAFRAQELEALSADLADPEGDTWAGTNLFAAFPPESSIALRHRNVLERVVGVLAAVSVFLPVGWTWSGFHQASAAYEQMILAQGEPEGRTFLGLWATGFDGRLAPSDQLAPMAGVSIALIVFAIFFIVMHRLVAGANVRREERDFQAARTELIKNLTAAQLTLNARRADHPLRIESIVKSSMDKLRKTQDAARKAVVELSTTAENVNTGVGDLLATVQGARLETEALLAQAKTTNEALTAATIRTEETVSRSISSLDAVVKHGVERSQSAVTQSVGALELSVKDGIQASRDNVRASGQELSEQLARAMSQFEQSLGDHVSGLTRETLAAIGQAGAALLGVVDRIGGSTETSAAAAGTLADHVSVMRDDNALAREELRMALEEVKSALESIELALSRHESTLQGHASELTGTRDAAERMLRHLTTSVASANGLHAESRS